MKSFEGFYIGTVVNNEDENKLGRIQVRVPNVYGAIKDEDLPWAEPNFPYTYDNQSMFFIPEKDAFVTVYFLNGSPYKPIYLGGIHREKENKVPDEISDKNYKYPLRKLIKTQTGYIMWHDDPDDSEKGMYIEIKHKDDHVIRIDEKEINIIHNSGTTCTIDEDGNVTWYVVGNETHNVDGDFSVQTSGNIYLN